jgi:hypothetical protein
MRKSLKDMVARDGVERFGGLCNQQVADCTMDTKDTKDSKDISCVRFVCGFSFRHAVADLPQRKNASRVPMMCYFCHSRVRVLQ